MAVGHETGDNAMRQLVKFAGGAALAAAVAASPVLAASPVGEWESGPRDQRYEIKLCGSEGKDLCAWLVYTSDPSPKARQFLNQLVLDTARNTGPNSWQGSMTLAGYQMSGTIRLVENNVLRINACALFVICGEFNLYRA
jgi:uncharacterized protein (DUF2147 family)